MCRLAKHWLWVDASSMQSLDQGYQAIARKAELYGQTRGGGQVKLRRKVVEWLEQQTQPWILVLDDFAISEDVVLGQSPCYPQSGRGIVVMTSRTKMIKIQASKEIQVGPLPLSAATQLLLDIAKKQHANDTEKAAAQELVQDLGCLPLAIRIAGNDIARKKLFITSYRTSWTKIFDNSTVQNPSREQKLLELTISLSYEHLKAQDSDSHRNAVELLQICSFLHPGGVSEQIFMRAWEAISKVESSYWHLKPFAEKRLGVFCLTGMQYQQVKENVLMNIRTALEILDEYSFVTFDGDEAPNSIYMNRIIHHWIRCRTRELENGSRKELQSGMWGLAAFTLAMSMSPEPDDSFLRTLAPHVETLSDTSNEGLARILSMRLPAHADYEAASRFASVFSMNGYFTQAQRLRHDIYKALESAPGSDSTELLEACSTLADAYSDYGEDETACSFRKRALELEESMGMGPSLKCVGDLADSYQRLHQYPDAHQLRQKICVEFEKNPPPKKEYLRARRDLATSHYDMGDKNIALDILKDVVQQYERFVERRELDPDGGLLASWSELARSYSASGYEKDALEQRLKVLDAGPRQPHHDFFVAKQDVANSYSKLGEHPKALQFRREIVQGFEGLKDRISHRHPSYLTAQYNLARSLLAYDEYLQEALQLFCTVYIQRVEVLGEGSVNHELLESKFGKASALAHLARQPLKRRGHVVEADKVEALKLGQEVVDRCREVCPEPAKGPPDWLYWQNELGKLNYELGNHSEAIRLHDEVLRCHTQLHENNDTVETRFLLAQNYFKDRQFSEAEDSLMQVLDQRERDMGPEHPTLIQPLEWLAKTYFKTEKDYVSVWKRVLSLQEKYLGPESEYTKETAKRIPKLNRSPPHDDPLKRKREESESSQGRPRKLR